MASSSSPRRDRASVAFGLLRLKSCPQGQLNHPYYPFPGPQQTRGLLPRRGGVAVGAAAVLGDGEDRRRGYPPAPSEAVVWNAARNGPLAGDSGTGALDRPRVVMIRPMGSTLTSDAVAGVLRRV
jgi:hypothetical protein